MQIKPYFEEKSSVKTKKKAEGAEKRLTRGIYLFLKAQKIAHKKLPL